MIATVRAGGNPYAVAYDPSNQFVYVTNRVSNNVTLINGTKMVGSVGAGSEPMGATYSPKTGYVYVANYGGNTITVLNGKKVLTTLNDPSLDGPYQGAYDPGTGYIYFTNANGWTVSVVNGTHVVNVVSVGHYPGGVTYDPKNHDIYVANDGSVANGGSNISVINGTTVVATISSSFTNPAGIAFDPRNGLIYVANKNIPSPLQGYVTVINNRTVVTTFSIGQDLFGMAYDPLNGFMYTVSSDNDWYDTSVIDKAYAINGTIVVGNITVGANAYYDVFNPTNGAIYVANGYNGTVSVIFGTLAEGPLTATPLGNPADSSDVGQSVRFNGTVLSTGELPDAVSVSTPPSPGGAGCGSPVISPTPSGDNLSVVCTPTAPGSYTVWLNVTDRAALKVWAWLPWQVFPDPFAATPVARAPDGHALSSVDIAEFFNLTVAIGPGSGPSAPIAWRGLQTGACTIPVSSTLHTYLTCRFLHPGSLNVSAAFNDSNGMPATSPSLNLPLNPSVLPSAPTANVSAADAGQRVTFMARATGGTGTYAGYLWRGLENATCTGLNSSEPSCAFGHAEIDAITVQITDSNGVASAISPALSFTVDEALRTTAPMADHPSADVGQRIGFTTMTSGGSGVYTYRWNGLPASCEGTQGSTPSCLAGAQGSMSASVIVTDSNGAHVSATQATGVLIDPDPVVGAVTVTPHSISAGSPVAIAIAVAGGAGGYHYHWVGLPAGCVSQDEAQLACNPTEVGAFGVAANVTDANGFVAMSNATTLTVTAGGAGSAIAGVSTAELYGIIVAVVVVAVGASWFVYHRRGGS